MPKTFAEFWKEVVHVWEHGLLGVDIGNIITALLIFFGFLIFRGLMSRYILHKLHQWAEKSSTKLDDSIVEALIPPIKFIPIVLGIFFAGKYLTLPAEMAFAFTNIMRSLIAFTIFWALHRAIDPFRRVFKRLDKILSKAMVDWMFRAVKVLVILIGAAVILEIWGIEVAPLLAGFGLLGVAVALGAQDLFKNLIAGLTVIAENVFHRATGFRWKALLKAMWKISASVPPKYAVLIRRLCMCRTASWPIPLL
ncbi:MAG: mechanosensitive ion channel family protein [Alphaproteobacteria bacterium]|nr:mechanosensitive ion channel family protein [Alphaproteobacteria bacterium]